MSEGTSTRTGVWGGPSEDPEAAERLRRKLAEGFQALIVCHGSPYVDGSARGTADISAGAESLRELRLEDAGRDGAVLQRRSIVVHLDQFGETPPQFVQGPQPGQFLE